MKDKERTIVQWMDLLWNNSFVNKMGLPFLCKKPGAIALVFLGLMADWLAVDEIALNLEIFTIIYWIKYSTFLYI